MKLSIIIDNDNVIAESIVEDIYFLPELSNSLVVVGMTGISAEIEDFPKYVAEHLINNLKSIQSNSGEATE